MTDAPEYTVKRPPEYRCPIHGNIGYAALSIAFDDATTLGPYCLRCFSEALEKLGLRAVEEVRR